MDSAPNISFAEWLERFLKNERLNARVFADKIGVHESMVSKLRNGVKPSRDIIDRIVARFGVDAQDIPRHNEATRPDADDADEEDPASDPSRTPGRHSTPHAVFNSVPDHIVLNWGIQKGLFADLGLAPADATRNQFRYPDEVLKLATENEKVLFVVPVSEEFIKLSTVQFFFLSNRYKGYALIARADAPISEVRFGSDALPRFRELFNRIINTNALWQVAILNQHAREFYGLVVEFFYDLQGLHWPKEEFAENLAELPTGDNEDLIKRLREIGSARSDFIMGHAFTAARARIMDDPKGVVMKEVLDWDSMIAVIDGMEQDLDLRARFKASLSGAKDMSARQKDEAVAHRISEKQEEWRKKFKALKLPVVWGITNAALDHIFAEQKGKYVDKTELLRALSKAASNTVAELKQNPRDVVEEVSEMLVTHQRGYNEQRVFWRSLKEQMQKVWGKSYEYLDPDDQEEYLEELLAAEEGPYVPYRALFKQLKELLPPRL